MMPSLVYTWIFLFILGIFPLHKTNSYASKSFHVGPSKRSILTFPPSSLLQINMGVALTSNFEKNSAAVVLAFQQFAPLLEDSQHLFTPISEKSRKKFSIYDHLTDVISSYGFNGSECLQKMVCQIAETPLAGGLLEDIVTLMLTPSRHRSIRLNDSSVDPVLESEELGKRGGNCTSAYPQCVRTPLDLISTLVHL